MLYSMHVTLTFTGVGVRTHTVAEELAHDVKHVWGHSSRQQTHF